MTTVMIVPVQHDCVGGLSNVQLRLSVLLCRKGEVACCEEIKAFAVKHNIKQQQIAVLAGSVFVMCAVQRQFLLLMSDGCC